MPGTVESTQSEQLIESSKSPTIETFTIPAVEQVPLISAMMRKRESKSMPESPRIPHGSGTIGADLIDETRLSRHNTRKSNRRIASKEEMKRKSQFFGKEFAYREPLGTVREKMTQDSMILVELKTNVIVKDEYTLITSLSSALAARYSRPESSILLNLTHSVCLLFGGSFDPAYILSIEALPSQVQPATNKRNTSLIQGLIAALLGVEPSRGVIKFAAIAEENFAFNGQTVLGEIESLEKAAMEDSLGIKRSASRSRLAMMRSRNRSEPEADSRSSTPVGMPQMPPIPTEMLALDRRAEKAQKLGKRKSLLSLFSKGS